MSFQCQEKRYDKTNWTCCLNLPYQHLFKKKNTKFTANGKLRKAMKEEVQNEATAQRNIHNTHASLRVLIPGKIY